MSATFTVSQPELSPTRTAHGQLLALFALVVYRYRHRGLPLPRAIHLMLSPVIDALFSTDERYIEVMYSYFSSIVAWEVFGRHIYEEAR